MAKRKKPSDEQGQDNENNNDADNFGLPDLDIKPLETPQDSGRPTEEYRPQEPVAESSSTQTTQESSYTETRSTYSYNMEEENKSKAPIIIGVAIALVVVVGGVLGYLFVIKPSQEKARLEKIAAEKRLAEEQEAIRQRQAAEEAERKRQQEEAAAAAAVPKEGTIETLTDRTKRYYVVVTSAVDGDLVMDYARKLSNKGVSTKIIPPFGKYKFSRLAIGDYDTFATAQAGADAAKAEYGSAVWVLKF